MPKIFRNAVSLFQDPSILGPYLVWTASRVRRRVPQFEVAPGVRIGEWINFSEYHSYTTASGVLPAEAAFFRRVLQGKGPTGVTFDVGANIGVFSCFFGSFKGTVHCFEPIPETFCRLRTNVDANSLSQRCVMNCIAVSDGSGFVTFKCNSHAPGANRIALHSLKGRESASLSTQQISMISLDFYCDRLGVGEIDLLKIDAEGMEPRVLAGASRLLATKRIRNILIEICPDNLAEAGSGPAQLYDDIMRFGYRPFLLKEDGSLDEPVKRDQFCALASNNVVLIPA